MQNMVIHLDMDSLFNIGFVDNLIECCQSRNNRSFRIQAAMTLHEFVRSGTMEQNQELLRRGVVPVFLQMLNDKEAIDLDDKNWSNDTLILEAVKTLALLSTKLDISGDLVTAFVEQNLCRRLMLLLRNTRLTIVENVLTFVENFLTRGTEDQIQVLLDNQVLHHIRHVIDNPAGSILEPLCGQYKAAEILGNFARRSTRLRDLVIDSGADLISLFRVLVSLSFYAIIGLDASLAISAARTIGYLCFGSPPPPFDKLRISLAVLRFLIDELEPGLGDEAHPTIKHVCLIIACLARGGVDPINELIEYNMCQRLVMHLVHPDSEIVASVMKFVQNFLKNGTENQIQVLHDLLVFPRVLHILMNHENRPPLHLRSICRAIANIVKYRSSQIQGMVNAGIFPLLNQISMNQEVGDKKYEAIYAISNVATRGSHEQIRYLVDHGSIAALCQGLLCEGYTRKTSCFQGLRVILRLGEAHKVDGVNVYTQMITENGGLARIKIQRDDRDVGEMARRLLSSFWPGEV